MAKQLLEGTSLVEIEQLYLFEELGEWLEEYHERQLQETKDLEALTLPSIDFVLEKSQVGSASDLGKSETEFDSCHPSEATAVRISETTDILRRVVTALITSPSRDSSLQH